MIAGDSTNVRGSNWFPFKPSGLMSNSLPQFPPAWCDHRSPGHESADAILKAKAANLFDLEGGPDLMRVLLGPLLLTRRGSKSRTVARLTWPSSMGYAATVPGWGSRCNSVK